MNYAIWVTTKCNLRCTYCYEKNSKIKLNLTKDMADKIVNYIIYKETVNERKVLDITYHGGEPFLNYDIIKYITSALSYALPKKKIYFSVTTNATILNNDISEFLKKYKFELSISIDGKKETHDLNRKYISGDGSHKDVVKNIKLFMKVSPEARARMTYDEDSVSELASNIYFLIQNGFKTIVPIQDFCSSKWGEKHTLILKEQIKIVKPFVIKYNVNIGICEPLEVSKIKVCCGGINSLNIYPDGKIYPCMIGTGIKEFEIGNINSDINLTKLNLILERSKHKIKECEGCSLYNYCENCRCRILNKVLRGSYDSPSGIVCSLNNLFYEVNGIDYGG